MNDIKEIFMSYQTHLNEEEDLKNVISEEGKHLENYVCSLHAQVEELHGNVTKKVLLSCNIPINDPLFQSTR